MKKIFSKILIAILILGFLFAPVTPKIDIQNHFSLVKNEVFAEDIYYYIILAVDGIKSVEKTTLNLCQEARDENLKSGTSVKTPCLKATSRAEIDAKIAEIKTETTQQEITEINKTYDGVLGDNFFNCEASTIFTNCLVAGLYHVFFSLSAFLASLSARILDYFVFYALDSDSYKGDFITLGWALVRDISNILFIIALLYVAGKTVLGLNTSNNKKIIGMVILMALLINFSLFISKVVIDISNIVARVFYANIENVDQSGNQNVAGYSDADGTTGKSISVGLVAQFDPQKIFQNSGIPQLVDGTVGPFAIVLILSIILMFYMTYMFLSVAFVFIGRVAMLWILMIFSPLAFVSNTVPDFKIPKFNFREWKSELFNQSFLAPIFVFFLYLIISFGKLPVVSDVIDPNTLNNVGGTATNGTLNTFMKIFIPFIIIFTLVKIAKDTTIKMAGDLGSMLSKVGPALGSLALGGAALGSAALLRGTVGAFAKGASTGDSAAIRYRDGTSRGTWDIMKGGMAQALTFGNTANLQESYGRRLNRQGGEIAHASHARHDLDQMASTITHGAKKTWTELNGQERLNVRVTMERNNWVRDNAQARGWGNKTYAQLGGAERNDVNNAIGVDNHGQIINNTSNLATNNAVADGLIRDARRKVGTIENIEQSAIGGSFDIRGLAKMIASEQDSALNKTLTGSTALIANGLRGGLRKTLGGITTGDSQKSFLKDLGKTLTEALKSVKLDIDVSKLGHEEKEDSKGHGGGHH